jgi:hypothetical protein
MTRDENSTDCAKAESPRRYSGEANSVDCAKESRQMGESNRVRPSVKGLLRMEAAELRAKAESYEALCRALPDEMSMAAEQALFSMITKSR